MTPLFTTDHLRAIEQAAGTAGLMEKAGLAAATLARDLVGDGTAILVFVGPGNNGGDALIAARCLKAWWFKVSVVFLGNRDRLPADAAAAMDAWLAVGGTIELGIPRGRFDLVIDGLFGIGLSKPLQNEYAELVNKINALSLPVLALDVPSGLCADSGRVLGLAVRASHTLSFLGPKPGLFTLDGPDHAGQVHVTDLGVTLKTPSPIAGEGRGKGVTSPGALIDSPPAWPAARLNNAHKGNFGSAGILGGDSSMVGAALMAARAALLVGAGRVYAGLLDKQTLAVDPMQPELMIKQSTELLGLDHLTALVVGPGMGRSAGAICDLQRALKLPLPLLLDADALHLLAANADLREQLRCRANGNIVTPHPGEAAALLGGSVAEIQANRIQSALKIAADYHAITVLKGCGTIIATPDGRWFINASGNPGMSVAGMGDVLCGLIVGLIAQGMDCENACLLGVYLHGAAGDALASDIGMIGLTASEVALTARAILNGWMREQRDRKNV